MSFDYGAPAELFLSKRVGHTREKYRRFDTAAEAVRHAVEDLRTPKALARGYRSGTSASVAAKSSACMRPMIIRCGSLSDRGSSVRAHTPQLKGALQPDDFRFSRGPGSIQKLGINPGRA
jgi:hypothetical protein